MYFSGSIGRITDYVKTVQLEQRWQQKKMDISAKSKENTGVSALLNPNADWIKTKRIGEIKSKMKAGRRLAHEEKEFLRIHAPDLYEKAIKIEKERDEFRRALARCKTKEEVRRLQASKAMEIQTEVQGVSISGNPKDNREEEKMEFMAMRMMAIFDEFAEFAKSKEYAEMPNEHEEDEEESEDAENNIGIEKDKRNKKSKFKKVKLTLNEEMAFNSYKLNEAKILNKMISFEPAKPLKSLSKNQSPTPNSPLPKPLATSH